MKRVSDQGRRAFWLKHLHQWHWISSALCLIGMLLFSVTGITLNHASQIEARPVVMTKTAMAPATVLESLADGPQQGKSPLPQVVADWLNAELPVGIGDHEAEWSVAEIYLSLPRPGGDAWLTIDREGGEVAYERTDRGWISFLNDLHKGRNAGAAWGWFIDIFAAATLIFCITGLFLLQLHAANRPFTWPIIGLGMVVPLLLAILFIH